MPTQSGNLGRGANPGRDSRRQARPMTPSSPQHQNQSHEKIYELAFPWMMRDLQGDFLPHAMQLKYREFLSGQDVGWMTADLSFLSTHKIRFLDCGDVRSVNAFSVGFHSAFFNALFKYNLETSVDIRLQWLSCISHSVSAALGSISLRDCRADLTDDNCLPMFMAADFILCERLRAQCLAYIRRRCSEDPGAALVVWSFARHLSLPDLVGASLKFVLRGFPELRLTEDFFQLEAEVLQEILGHRMLNCASELQVLQTIGQWMLRHSGPDAHGKQAVELLLCCVRVGQLHSDELTAALADPMVRGNAEFSTYLRSFPLPSVFSLRHGPELARSRNPRWPQRVLLLLGGWFKRQGPAAFCQVYDPRADLWDLRSPGRRQQVGWLDERSHACCALLGDTVHVVGGYSGTDALKSVLCFDRSRPYLGWYEGSCMLQPRYYHCCAALGGFLYAIGGQTADRRLTHVERLRQTDNSWVAIDPLRQPRCEAAAVAFGDKVIVVGGFDGRVHLDTVEVYCPNAGAWTLFTGCLNQPRTGLGLVALDGAIYALCGRNSSGWRRCVERSEDAKNWRAFCETNKARSNFGCDVLDGKIYLLGGVCGPTEKDIVATVEWLDPTLKSTGPAHPMPFPASGLTTCVLDLTDLAMCQLQSASTSPAPTQPRGAISEDDDAIDADSNDAGKFWPAPLRLLTEDTEDEEDEPGDSWARPPSTT